MTIPQERRSRTLRYCSLWTSVPSLDVHACNLFLGNLVSAYNTASVIVQSILLYSTSCSGVRTCSPTASKRTHILSNTVCSLNCLMSSPRYLLLFLVLLEASLRLSLATGLSTKSCNIWWTSISAYMPLWLVWNPSSKGNCPLRFTRLSPIFFAKIRSMVLDPLLYDRTLWPGCLISIVDFNSVSWTNFWRL